MMSLFRITILLLVAYTALPLSAQVKRRNFENRVLSEHSALKLDPNGKWYNTTYSYNMSYQPDRIIMLHIWHPEDLRGDKTMALANDLRKKHSFLNMVTVVWVNDEVWDDPHVVQALIDKHKINHPVFVARDFSELELQEVEPGCMFLGYSTDRVSFGKFLGEELFDIVDFADFLADRIPHEINVKTANLFPIRTIGEIEQPMHFPGAIVCQESRDICFVLEPLKHRVLMIDGSGAVVDIIGSSTPGNRDGKFGSCLFNHPQGIALDEPRGYLYVADSENHSIKRVDLFSRDVVTVLGDGNPRKRKVKWVDSTAASINYPTGLAIGNDVLYIAMTGDNQVWQYDGKSKRGKPILGDGQLQTLDGARGKCSIAEPVELAVDDKGGFYVFEQFTRNLRYVDKDLNVVTLEVPPVEGKTIGVIKGLHFAKGRLFFADHYNQRLIVHDSKGFQRLAGSGVIGHSNHKKNNADFFMPTAISSMGNHLFVVDQHNYMLRKVHHKNGKAKSVHIKRLEQLFMSVHAFERGYQKAIEDIFVKPGLNTVFIKLVLPPHLEWHNDGRNEVEIEPSSYNRLITARPRDGYVELEVKGSEYNPGVNLQLYMTVRDKRDNSVHFRTALLLLLFIPDSDEGTVHDLTWEAFPEIK